MPLPLFALFAATFAVGTTELVVAGLLPDLAADLAVDIPTAGLLITGYAIGVAIGGPLLALVTGKLPRKPLLLAAMGVFIAGNVLCALATSYWLLMGARLVIACSHGLVFGVSMVIATALVRKERQATAISVVVAGVTVANVIGVPLGTAIGNAFGWRMAFWVVAAIGAVAAMALVVLLPRDARDPSDHGASAVDEIAVVLQAPVLLSYAMIALAMTAFFGLLAYIAPTLLSVTGVSTGAVPWVLFVSGVGGIVGNLIGGRLGDWKPMPALIGMFALQCVLYLVGLVAVHEPLAMTINVFLWSMVGFSFGAPVQTRILRAAHAAPNFAATLTSTAFNIGIAAGAWLGSVALENGWGYADLPRISAAFVAGALAIAVLSLALDRRRAAVFT